MNWQDRKLRDLIERALAEDVGAGDITSEAIIDSNSMSCAKIKAKQKGVLAGILLAEQVFKTVDRKIKFRPYKKDGSQIKKGETIALVCGKTRSILQAERVALNFLQRLCGIATLTNEFVKKVRETKLKILDTRKTTPTLRLLEKYAVRMGGGENHRFGLYDMILIKDNHIRACGSVKQAALRAKSFLAKSKSRRGIKIEAEIRNIRELEEAVKSGVDRVMLDNMKINDIRKCVKLVRSSKKKMEIEVSGSVNLKNVRELARTGVDFISIGALTHSALALDLNLVLN
ncbi:MAG: carboxylating nicotinate-nucleotide diphosphorylase [candidate division Zixibacteria bacterium]|nr:carboxylating nicotinate-nucleotide diphosphorylase [candidate division Zixibacteria bacterium]